MRWFVDLPVCPRSGSFTPADFINTMAGMTWAEFNAALAAEIAVAYQQ